MSEEQKIPNEYLPVVQMIRKEDSIRNGVNALKAKILVSAGDEFLSWDREKQDQFFERTVLAIAKDEKLAACFDSTEGKLSIIEAVEKAVSTGLQIGGVHAYLVPQGRNVKRRDASGKEISVYVVEIRFSIRDRGYYALLCGGKKPIFADLRWGQVYEKDNCTIDKGTGNVNHAVSICDDKGKFLGCWVQCTKINNQKEVEFYSVSKINQWASSSKNKEDFNIWKKWFDEMALQASIRHFCERYEKARELIASALYNDEGEPEIKTTIESIDEALTEKEPEKHVEVEKVEKKVVKNADEKTEAGEKLDLF
jgi:recombinational DNA repair protein RecT